LLEADFAVATVLISFGAILGVSSPVQLTVMAVIEVVCYNVSIYVGVTILKVSDLCWPSTRVTERAQISRAHL